MWIRVPVMYSERLHVDRGDHLEEVSSKLNIQVGDLRCNWFIDYILNRHHLDSFLKAPIVRGFYYVEIITELGYRQTGRAGFRLGFLPDPRVYSDSETFYGEFRKGFGSKQDAKTLEDDLFCLAEVARARDFRDYFARKYPGADIPLEGFVDFTREWSDAIFTHYTIGILA